MAQHRVGEETAQVAHKTPPRPHYQRSTLSQLTAVIIGAPIAFFAFGASFTWSLLCGAACALIPHAYFAFRMSMASRGSAAGAARAGLAAEGGKFLLSAGGFALVFALIKPAHPGAVFVGFGVLWVVQMVSAFALLRN